MKKSTIVVIAVILALIAFGGAIALRYVFDAQTMNTGGNVKVDPNIPVLPDPLHTPPGGTSL